MSGDGYTGYSAFAFTESLAVPFKATATQNTANVQPTEAYMYLAYNAEMRFDFTVGEVMPDGAIVTVGGQEKQATLTNVSGNNFTLSVPLYRGFRGSFRHADERRRRNRLHRHGNRRGLYRRTDCRRKGRRNSKSFIRLRKIRRALFFFLYSTLRR